MKSWRLWISLLLTAFVSFWLLIYLFFYYDELHIKSTDYQLKDNLTNAQVIVDLTTSVAFTLFLATVFALFIYWFNKAKGVAHSGRAVAIACWLFMFTIIMGLSISHYKETNVRIENEKRWRVENSP